MRTHCHCVGVPRTVDHDVRRAVLAGAVLRLVARNGLEAVSLRAVAAEAGASMGQLQYYFAAKHDLLLYGLEQAHWRMGARITERLAGVGGTDREMLAAVLTDGDDEILALAVEVVAQAQAAGQVGRDADPDRDGYLLFTLARGLGIDVALYGAPPGRARAALRHALRLLAPANAEAALDRR